ncbi:hypothetical protein [Priestia aryabhattai]
MTTNTKIKKYAKPAFVLSIVAFVLGIVPVFGWILLIPATIFFVFSLKNKEKSNLKSATAMMLGLTWIIKICVIIYLLQGYQGHHSKEIVNNESKKEVAQEESKTQGKLVKQKEELEKTKNNSEEKERKEELRKAEFKEAEQKKKEQRISDFNEIKPEALAIADEFDHIWDSYWTPTMNSVANGQMDVYEAYQNMKILREKYFALGDRIDSLNVPSSFTKEQKKYLEEFKSGLTSASNQRALIGGDVMKMLDKQDFSPSKVDKISFSAELSNELATDGTLNIVWLESEVKK